MPVTSERQFMKPEIMARSGLRPSIRTSKRPQCHAVSRRPSSTRLSASGGSIVSAWRNSSTSPVAAAAPAFICAPRPRGAAITRSASGPAISTVRSRLPPSTTITSAPRARNGASADSAAPMRAASSSTGTMMEREAMRRMSRTTPPPLSARRRSSSPGRRCSRSNGRRRGSDCFRCRRRAIRTDARAPSCRAPAAGRASG